ncbi:MAG: rRNA maturation RNase YbeY [Bacteroidales bacterium]|jgi:rRNA maturation RNase YbeY|nr:rRNA maturation RNase YbeY [Bacteroidales bacterium]
MSTISFFASSEKVPAFSRKYFRQGITALVMAKKKKVGDISYIFCTDEELLSINKKYLNHNTYTDIITFDYTDGVISGDIFISVERVRENSRKFEVAFKQELLRVMVHGVLHLLGLKDKTDAESKRMRTAEDKAMKKYLAEFH